MSSRVYFIFYIEVVFEHNLALEHIMPRHSPTSLRMYRVRFLKECRDRVRFLKEQAKEVALADTKIKDRVSVAVRVERQVG